MTVEAFDRSGGVPGGAPWEREWREYEELHHERPIVKPAKGKERLFSIVEPTTFARAWGELQRLADERGFTPNGLAGNQELTLRVPTKLQWTLTGRLRRRHILYTRLHGDIPQGA